MIAYRNRTSGHGAPQRDHINEFAPILEAAVVELLLHLTSLKALSLVYLSEIRLERHSFVHCLTRLVGTSQMNMTDYITAREEALVGGDRSLYLLDPGTARPVLSLHPLMIYAQEEVFLLQHSDMDHTVEYLCYHTGATYEADHIFEDFQRRFARFLTTPGMPSVVDIEAVYLNAVRMSLLDGHIAEEERKCLDDLAKHIKLSPEMAGRLELSVASEPEVTIVAEVHTSPYSPASMVTDASSLGTLLDQHSRLLRDLGRDILEFVSQRNDASRPVRLPELLAALQESKSSAALRISSQELSRLIVDVQNHGFAPGLIKTPAGYAVVEPHIAFKLTRDKTVKLQIARMAVAVVQSGMRVGLDGGSTTLPIADELIAALDAELLSDLTVVTNSLPIAEHFADFIERRGWIDHNSPVQLLICGGRVRAVTEAIADVGPEDSVTRDSLDGLLRLTSGLNCCFVGANGISSLEGITLPTEPELRTKRSFLSASERPYIVADPAKFGLHYPFQIADWNAKLTLLTVRPTSSNNAFDEVLARERIVEIKLAGED